MWPARLSGALFVTSLAAAAAGAETGRQREPQALPDFVRDVSISVHTSPETLTVGDRVTLEVRVEAPAGLEISFLTPKTASAQVEVKDVEARPPETRDDKSASRRPGRAKWTGRYTLAVFAVGDIVFPPWPVQVRADTQVAVVHTDSVRLHVQSVLDDSLAAADMRDLKPQQAIPVPLPAWLWVLAGALAGAGGLAWWLLHRRRRRVPAAPVLPLRPAHEVALAELRRLESLRLPFEGRFKEHYVRLSEILRHYLEESHQFGIAALEETTDEIVRELDAKHYKPLVLKSVSGLCEEADLVKFAKHEPSIEACNAALERLRGFVLDTSKAALFELREEPVFAAVAASAAAGLSAGAHAFELAATGPAQHAAPGSRARSSASGSPRGGSRSGGTPPGDGSGRDGT